MEQAKLPSNRSFGLLFTAVFGCMVGYGIYKHWPTAAVATSGLLAVVLAVLTWLAPHKLAPFNLLWFKLGELLGRIVSPIVLGAIFFLVLTPVGVLSRLFGRDELKIKKRQCETYWVERNPPGPDPDSFKNSF